MDSNGKLNAKGTTGSTILDSTALTTGTWYLVGVTFDGTTLKLFKNGTQVGSTAATTTANSTTLYIGDSGGTSGSFNGTLDEVRYYNSDMSVLNSNGLTRMQQLYNNLAALLPFQWAKVLGQGGRARLRSLD